MTGIPQASVLGSLLIFSLYTTSVGILFNLIPLLCSLNPFRHVTEHYSEIKLYSMFLKPFLTIITVWCIILLKEATAIREYCHEGVYVVHVRRI